MNGLKIVKFADEISIKRIRVAKVNSKTLEHLVGRIFSVYAVARDMENQIKVFFKDRDNTMYSLTVDCVENATLKIVK